LTTALRKELQKILAETFRIALEDLPEAPTADNTKGWDSLAHMTLIETLEHRFGVTINHEESVSLLSEQEIIDFLKAKGIDIPGGAA
jgi:acyl carrier protein